MNKEQKERLKDILYYIDELGEELRNKAEAFLLENPEKTKEYNKRADLLDDAYVKIYNALYNRTYT